MRRRPSRRARFDQWLQRSEAPALLFFAIVLTGVLLIIAFGSR